MEKKTYKRGMKWTAILAAVALVVATAGTASARPGPHHGPPPMHHHHHGGSAVGAFVGACVGLGILGALASAAEPEPAVVYQQPVVVQQQPVVVQQPVVAQTAETDGTTQAQTVVYTQPQTVVYQPQPTVVYQPRPVVVRPRPVVHYHYSGWW